MTTHDAYATESGDFAAVLHSGRRRRLGLGAAAAATAALAIAANAPAVTLYVDDDAPLGGNGLSWATPYRYLQDAMKLAEFDGDITEIRIGQGTYLPDISENFKSFPGDRTETFVPRGSNLVVAGGYEGFGAANPDNRDIALFETILSGDLNADDAPNDFTGNGENSFNVMTISFADNSLVVDGLTIERGNANGTSQFGGGVLNEGGGSPGGQSSPLFVDVTFTLNAAIGSGGGMSSFVGSPLLIRCDFEMNQAADGGGIFLSTPTSATFDECSFTLNAASGDGGGLYGQFGTITTTNTDLDQNTAGFRGGGAYLTVATFNTNGGEFTANHAGSGGGLYGGFGSGGTSDFTTFDGNTCDEDGAGANLCGGSRTFDDCDLENNVAGGGGGGLFTSEGASATLISCSTRFNTALGGLGGGGIAACGSSLDMDSGLVGGNTAVNQGGGIYLDATPTTIDSVFIDANSAASGGGVAQVGGAATFVGSSLIGNEAALGGAYYLSGGGSQATLVNCFLLGNEALTGLARGGAIAVDSFATLDLTNGLLLENSAVRGGAIYSNASNTTVSNCSFNANLAGLGGAIYITLGEAPQGGGVFINNSILWGDSATSAGSEIFNTGVFTGITNCCVEGSGGSGEGWDSALGGDGGGNIDEDPQYEFPLAAGKFSLRLEFGSPAINAGSNALLPADVTDLDGDENTIEDLPFDFDDDPRVQNFQVDMGAYEANVMGACCFGTTKCIETTEFDCKKSGGTYLGDGTDCFGSPCEDLTGACCLPGDCIDGVTANECFDSGGFFFFQGFTCASGVCDGVNGACCFFDDSCLFVDSLSCAKSGGDFQGDGVPCESVQCGEPEGACCLVDGTCLDEVLESDCDDMGGTFQGDQTSCGPQTCPPLPPIVLGEPQEVIAFDEPAIEAVADFDNDGDDDVVIVIPMDNLGPTNGFIQVFRNLGTDVDDVWLGLEALPAVEVGLDPRGIAVGDLTDDGFVDLAVANSGDDSVTFLINDATGAPGFFAAPVQVFLSDLSVPRGIAIAEFTGDTLNDLVVSNLGTDDVVLYENMGVPPAPSGFGQPPDLDMRDQECVGEEPIGVCPEDVDNDRDTDLLVVTFGGGRIGGLENDPGFGPSGSIFRPEVAIPVGAGPTDVAVADFDDNGFLDFVTSNSEDGTLTLALNFGGFDSFDVSTPPIPTSSTPRAVDAGDFDDDTDPDVVVAVAVTDQMNDPGVQVFKNTQADAGMPSLVDSTGFNVDADPVWIAVAQLDDDGIVDVVTSNNDAAGGTGGSVTGLVTSVCPADLNGDGETGFMDLLSLLSWWGPCEGCPADLNNDGVVGMQDLLLLLFLWGGC